MYMRSIRQRSSEMKTHREERNLSIFIVSLIKRVVVKKQDWTKGCDLTVTSQGGLRRAHVLRFCSVSSVLKVPFGDIQGRQVGLLGLPPRTACFQGDGMQKATGRCSVGSLGCQGDMLGWYVPRPILLQPTPQGGGISFRHLQGEHPGTSKGQVFGAVVKRLLGTPRARIRAPTVESISPSNSSFLLMHPLRAGK